jgi:prolyl-tRNA editing enzyme YbaK/EbsC (Cys-tRNA(Pro) deacylase)
MEPTMKDALAIHRALLEWETLHEIVRLPVAMTTADELPKALGLPAERCLVTRVYACEGGRRGRRLLAGVIVPAGGRPRAEMVRRAVGARTVRPARPDLVNAVTEYAAGLVCPLLLPESMPLLIDPLSAGGADADDVVYTATGEASTALGIRRGSLYALCRARPMDMVPATPLPSPAAPPAPPAAAPPAPPTAAPPAGAPQTARTGA